MTRHSQDYPLSFYLSLKDLHGYRDMIDGLESQFRIEERQFRAIFGSQSSHRIYADRSVAEKIDIQTSFLSELYNVDVRQDQRYMAEMDLFPCGELDESRFAHDFDIPLSCMDVQVVRDPRMPVKSASKV